MSNKPLKKAQKRVNKTVQEIKSDFLKQEKIAHIKAISKEMFPVVQAAGTIYDGQTVVNALSGFIKPHLEEQLRKIKLSDIDVLKYLEDEKDSEIKRAIVKLIEMMKDESAVELSETLDRFGKVLSEYSANTYMKQPMTVITISDLIA